MSNLTLNAVGLSDVADYTVRVSNPAGMVVSTLAHLAVKSINPMPGVVVYDNSSTREDPPRFAEADFEFGDGFERNRLEPPGVDGQPADVLGERAIRFGEPHHDRNPPVLEVEAGRFVTFHHAADLLGHGVDVHAVDAQLVAMVKHLDLRGAAAQRGFDIVRLLMGLT